MNAPQNEAPLNGSPAALTEPAQSEIGEDAADDHGAALLAPREGAEPREGQQHAGPAGDRPRPDLPKIIRFDALSRCGDEIWIENGGQIYRLRKTRQGKLILTK